MKILIATKEKQTGNDFCWTEGDEIVKFPMECCNSYKCGCNRSWVGTISSKSTTTAKVVESPITINGLAKIIYNSMVKEGWVRKDTTDITKKDILKQCRIDAKEISQIASRRKVGTIIRRESARVFDA
jgi:hypothetical protein